MNSLPSANELQTNALFCLVRCFFNVFTALANLSHALTPRTELARSVNGLHVMQDTSSIEPNSSNRVDECVIIGIGLYVSVQLYVWANMTGTSLIVGFSILR
jgi:hypothetical protein